MKVRDTLTDERGSEEDETKNGELVKQAIALVILPTVFRFSSCLQL